MDINWGERYYELRRDNNNLLIKIGSLEEENEKIGIELEEAKNNTQAFREQYIKAKHEKEELNYILEQKEQRILELIDINSKYANKLIKHGLLFHQVEGELKASDPVYAEESLDEVAQRIASVKVGTGEFSPPEIFTVIEYGQAEPELFNNPLDAIRRVEELRNITGDHHLVRIIKVK